MHKRYVLLLVFLFTFFTFSQNVFAQFFPFDESSVTGQKAKNFSVPTMSGSTLTVNETLFKNKTTLMFFWATWCPHCREALQDLKGRLAELKDKKVQVILIDLGEDAGKVKQYLGNVKVDVDSGLDLDNSVAEQYGVVGIPTFVLVDATGTIKSVEHALPEI
ncbi:MAG: TlpA family protein disulfide reductase [Candidatus Omnitrophica bacterium]|nr:TlpA family protein disulfide reductase [Candidatus Omnitrophota bacterium]